MSFDWGVIACDYEGMSKESKSVLIPKEKELRDRLNLQEAAVLVPVAAEAGAAGHCFPTVRAVVGKKGGQMVCGWRIHEIAGLYVEAEFHAVWQSPEGALIDVTGGGPDPNHCVFIPDPGRNAPNERVMPVQVALIDHPKMDEFLRIYSDMVKEKNRLLEGRNSGFIPMSPTVEKLDGQLRALARELQEIAASSGGDSERPQ